MINKSKVAGVFLIVWLSVQPIWALTIGSCSISATAVNFGNYNVFNVAPTDSVGDVTVTCTVILGVLSSYDVILNKGSSGSYAPRKMQKVGGSDMLDYNLYQDAAHTTVWGDGTGGTNDVTSITLVHVGTVTDVYNVYGRIPAGQNVRAGSYNDTITATVDY